MAEYYVYILSNPYRNLYIGVTNNLTRRMYEHKKKLVEGFTQRHNITELVFFESTTDIRSAILREKQLKGWIRAKKIKLIESVNPNWQDLSNSWFDNQIV